MANETTNQPQTTPVTVGTVAVAATAGLIITGPVVTEQPIVREFTQVDTSSNAYMQKGGEPEALKSK